MSHTTITVPLTEWRALHERVAALEAKLAVAAKAIQAAHTEGWEDHFRKETSTAWSESNAKLAADALTAAREGEETTDPHPTPAAPLSAELWTTASVTVGGWYWVAPIGATEEQFRRVVSMHGGQAVPDGHVRAHRPLPSVEQQFFYKTLLEDLAREGLIT